MAAKKPTALVYSMAQELSKMIGAEIVISSTTVVNTSTRGPEKGRRYDVLIKRDGHSFRIPNYRLQDLTKSVAMFNDWIEMGFVRLLPDPYFGPGSIVTWGCGVIGAEVVTNDVNGFVVRYETGKEDSFKNGPPPGIRIAPKVGKLIPEDEMGLI